MAKWLNLGQHLTVNASKSPDKLCLKDQSRAFSYSETNRRVNRLTHSLATLGLEKGDKVAVFMDNCIEFVEIYLAVAKVGIIIVPVNFRLVGQEVAYIVDNADAKAMIVEERLVDIIDPIKKDLPKIGSENYVVVGDQRSGYIQYDAFLAISSDTEPVVEVDSQDPWILIYTSGTTGKPKGVIRSHESHIAFYLINAVDFGFNERDYCLNIMPLCHINTTFYTFLFIYLGGSVYIHPSLSFKADRLIRIVEAEKITFISLIPTHYNLILSVDEESRKRDVSSIRKLLCSSAPVSIKMKHDIMNFFPNAQLYEAYGSTEAGVVTVLKPEDQMIKTGSIGQESLGTNVIKILDGEGKEVPIGQVGEIYSKSPMLFKEYYKLPEKTAESLIDGWFSAGDMGRKDEDGYYYIVDRKNNMIITGGENVYPSEVERVVASHLSVSECACIGIPDEKWGEKIAVVVTLKKKVTTDTDIIEKDIKKHCRENLAGYKLPKQIIFITDEEMPRTSTGKILHRKLRGKFS